MLKASSLFYTIALSIIIAIVSSCLILFSYLNKLQFETYLQLKSIQRNADSGINLLLSEQQLVPIDKKVSIDLYHKQLNFVTLQRKSWGAFEIITSVASFKNHVEERVAQVGSGMDGDNSMALYMADLDRPLSLCGKTMIKGTAYLPEAGVKRAYIEGQNFLGTKLINGEIKKSAKIIPEPDKAIIERINNLLERSFNETDSVVDIESAEINNEIANSFHNNSLFLVSDHSLILSGVNYSGNIAIVSNGNIKVAADAALHEVILYAKKIEIAEDFTGTIQAFATDSIVVGKRCTLAYPSVLGVIRTPGSPNFAVVIMDEDAALSGSVFAFQERNDPRKQVGVLLKQKTTVTGQVYSNGFVDIKGTIMGSLICNKITLQTPSSVYENHLLNAVIDRTSLSKHYAGLRIEGQAENKKIMKWLY